MKEVALAKGRTADYSTRPFKVAPHQDTPSYSVLCSANLNVPAPRSAVLYVPVA